MVFVQPLLVPFAVLVALVLDRRAATEVPPVTAVAAPP